MAITYRFRFTDDFLIAAMVKYRSQLWWRRPFRGSEWILAIAIAGLFALCVAYQLRWPALACAAVLGPLVLGWPIEKALLRWRFRKSPFRDDDLVFTLSDDGVLTIGSNSEIRLAWSAYTKAYRFADGLLLFQGPHVFNWLPDSASGEQADLAAAQELVRRHVKDYRDV